MSGLGAALAAGTQAGSSVFGPMAGILAQRPGQTLGTRQYHTQVRNINSAIALRDEQKKAAQNRNRIMDWFLSRVDDEQRDAKARMYDNLVNGVGLGVYSNESQDEFESLLPGGEAGPMGPPTPASPAEAGAEPAAIMPTTYSSSQATGGAPNRSVTLTGPNIRKSLIESRNHMEREILHNLFGVGRDPDDPPLTPYAGGGGNPVAESMFAQRKAEFDAMAGLLGRYSLNPGPLATPAEMMAGGNTLGALRRRLELLGQPGALGPRMEAIR